MTNCTTFSWCYWPKRKIPSLNFRLDGALCKPCFANTFVLCTICTFNASALRKFACTGHVVRAQPPPPQKKKQRNNPIIYCKVRFTWSTAPMAVLWSFSLWPIAPMHDYVRRVNFTNKPRLWTKFFAFARFVRGYSFQLYCLGNSFLWNFAYF